MSKLKEEIMDKLREVQSQNKKYDSIYLTYEEFHKLEKESSFFKDFEDEYDGEFMGRKVFQDEKISSFKILPSDVTDLHPDDYFMEEPPERLVKQLLDIQVKESFEYIRGVEIKRYTTRPFFKALKQWQKIDDDIVEKYNLKPKYNIDELKDYEEDLNEEHQMKFGKEITKTPGAGFIGREKDIEKEIIDQVIDYTNSINETYIYGVRERTIKGPYPVLDIEHREEKRCGTHYIEYGGLFMRPVDTDANKIVD